jgi:hypothetical protein
VDVAAIDVMRAKANQGYDALQAKAMYLIGRAETKPKSSHTQLEHP